MADGRYDIKKYLKALKDDRKLMDALDKAFVASGDSYEKAVVDQLDQILTDLISVDGIVRPTGDNMQLLDRIDERVFDILEGQGLENFTTDFNKIMQRRLETLDRLVKSGGIDGATGIDFQNLDIMEDKLRRSLSKIGDASEFTAAEIRDQILSYKLDMNAGTGVKFSELRDALIKKANILPRYAGTVANTELYSISRTARIMQTKKAGLTKMKYVGVQDNLTRPFCVEHIGMVETVEFWESHQNYVEPNPVSEYGGGWNCRHDLIPWADEFEVAYNKSHPPSKTPPPAPRKTPTKPAPPATPPPDPQAPAMVDNRAIEMTHAKLPDKFMTEMAVLMQKKPKFNVKGDAGHRHERGAGAYYMPLGHSVNFVKGRNGKVRRKTIVHEYGHAVHYDHGIATGFMDTPKNRLFNEKVFNPLKKRLTALKRSDAAEFDRLFGAQLNGSGGNISAHMKKLSEAGGDLKLANEQWSSFADTILALTNGRNGWGHKKSYIRQRGNAQAELIAHGFEYRYLGRSFLDNIEPEYKSLIDDFMKRFNEFVDENLLP